MGKSPARQIRFRGTVENRHEANQLLEQPGDSVTVVRGRLRSFVMACPDGCGSVLTVNLDPRAGKAWRYYARDRISIYPSVWRDGGCGAHFVLWQDKILWCDGEDGAEPPKYDPIHEGAVFAALSDIPKTANEIADDLDDIPWEVDRSLKHLVRAGRVDAIGKEPTRFRLAQLSPERVAAWAVQPLPTKKPWWRRLLLRD